MILLGSWRRRKRVTEGAAPIKEDLTFLTSLNNLTDINKNLTNLPFEFEVELDFKIQQLKIDNFYWKNLVLADTSYFINMAAGYL